MQSLNLAAAHNIRNAAQAVEDAHGDLTDNLLAGASTTRKADFIVEIARIEALIAAAQEYRNLLKDVVA
jgi:hypothetical protein